jgi:hypothetical protein
VLSSRRAAEVGGVIDLQALEKTSILRRGLIRLVCAEDAKNRKTLGSRSL